MSSREDYKFFRFLKAQVQLGAFLLGLDSVALSIELRYRQTTCLDTLGRWVGT